MTGNGYNELDPEINDSIIRVVQCRLYIFGKDGRTGHAPSHGSGRYTIGGSSNWND